MYRKTMIAGFCAATSLLLLSPLASAEDRTGISTSTARLTNQKAIEALKTGQREEFKAKLATLKDERKKEVVERVDTRLSTLNANMTDHFTKVLARLTTILDKIATKTERAKTNGTNVAAVETAIASARAAISTAETAVTTQKAKTYVITINSESTLRTDVSTVVQSLKTDLKAVKEVVQSARRAVISAAVALGQAMGTATPTPTP